MSTENKGEKHIRQGWMLVGVDMGEGFEKFNDPSMALDYLIKNCDKLGRFVASEVRNVVGTTDRSSAQNYALRPYLRRALRFDSDIVERFKTAQLELAWLFGRTAIVDELVKEQVEDRRLPKMDMQALIGDMDRVTAEEGLK